MRSRIDALASFFERFQRAHVEELGLWYAADAKFKDPFNDVQGLAAIQRIYTHMFDAVQDPRFRVTSRMAEGREGWLAWDFTFTSAGREELVRGATHLLFAEDGRIAVHRDYWDPAEELYEKVPVLGALMRWIKRRVAAR